MRTWESSNYSLLIYFYFSLERQSTKSRQKIGNRRVIAFGQVLTFETIFLTLLVSTSNVPMMSFVIANETSRQIYTNMSTMRCFDYYLDLYVPQSTVTIVQLSPIISLRLYKYLTIRINVYYEKKYNFLLIAFGKIGQILQLLLIKNNIKYN